MTRKFYSKFSIVAIVVLLALCVSLPAQADEMLYLPLIANQDESGAEDSSWSDGTCLFWRAGNDIYLSIYVTMPKYLHVVTSSANESEPYVFLMSPRSLQVGVVDGNGESFTGYTYEDGKPYIRCDAQFEYLY